MKQVYQYSLDGRFIQKYKSISNAATVLGCDESTIRKSIIRRRPALKFFWKEIEENLVPSIKNATINTKTYTDRYVSSSANINTGGGNVLVIGDTHLPFEHKDYLEHCKTVYKMFNCDTVVHIGDIIDNHAASFHDSDPDGFGGGNELELAKKSLQDWYRAFPNVYVTLGNHDAIPFRKAFKSGVPSSWLKSYEEILEAPAGWKFSERWILDNVLYTHGTGANGDMAAVNMAKDARMSVVIGHSHSFAGVRYLANINGSIFGMNVGCGIDESAYAFAYAKFNLRRPVLSCGVVMGGKQAFVITLD
jgi:predicted phosphodiesterase